MKAPYFYNKKVLKEVLQTWPEEFEKTSRSKFRSKENLLVAYLFVFTPLFFIGFTSFVGKKGTTTI